MWLLSVHVNTVDLREKTKYNILRYGFFKTIIKVKNMFNKFFTNKKFILKIKPEHYHLFLIMCVCVFLIFFLEIIIYTHI